LPTSLFGEFPGIRRQTSLHGIFVAEDSGETMVAERNVSGDVTLIEVIAPGSFVGCMGSALKYFG
jgi:hypothetical protein